MQMEQPQSRNRLFWSNFNNYVLKRVARQGGEHRVINKLVQGQRRA